MLLFQENKKGSVKYKNKWYMFDQIMVSTNFLNSTPLKFLEASVFDAPFLQEKSNKRKGAPKRTFIGKWHQGGFSDHFPVLVYFKNS